MMTRIKKFYCFAFIEVMFGLVKNNYLTWALLIILF